MYFLFFSVIKLPFTDGCGELNDEYEDLSKTLSRMSNPLSSTSIKMTKAAIAGIDMTKLKSFLPGAGINILQTFSNCHSHLLILYKEVYVYIYIYIPYRQKNCLSNFDLRKL